MASPGADPGDKGGSVGNKWLVLPLPHRLGMGPGWRVEQGIMSSFQRTSRNANIPLQVREQLIKSASLYTCRLAKTF